MSVDRLRRRLLGAALAAAAWAAAPARAADQLVLVANARSGPAALNSVEVHKLFVGLTVVVDGRRLRGLRNDADPLMRQVFFQTIVSMSEAVYDRRMLALTLQQGRTAPPVFRSTAEVLNALAEDDAAVSFVWAAEAARDPRVKVLRVIWHP